MTGCVVPVADNEADASSSVGYAPQVRRFVGHARNRETAAGHICPIYHAAGLIIKRAHDFQRLSPGTRQPRDGRSTELADHHGDQMSDPAVSVPG